MSSKSNASAHPQAFPGQHPDEQVLMVFRHHPLVMRKPLIFGLFAVLVVILPFVFYQIYAYPWLVSLLAKVVIATLCLLPLYWGYHFISWYYSVYVVTDQRIVEITQVGLFNRRVNEWRLDMIRNINYHVDGFQAVLFGFGNLTAQTFTGDLVMESIHKPTEIHEQLLKIVQKHGGGSTRTAFSGSIT